MMTTTAPQYLIDYGHGAAVDTADSMHEAIRKAQAALSGGEGEAVIYQAARVVASRIAVDVSEYRAPPVVEAACASSQ